MQQIKSNMLKLLKLQYEEQDPIRGKTIVQDHGDKYLVVQINQKLF